MYVFEPAPSKITKNHDEWSFRKMFQRYGSEIVNDKPKYQRPDVDGSLLLFGEGNEWQKELMRDVIKGNPFQPIHLRLTNNDSWEILDGGHRTRTIYKFLSGYVRLPKNTILVDKDGKEYDISNMTFLDIFRVYPILENYIWDLLTFEVYEYRDLSDKDAEELFLKLNNLHEMSHADKRNAIDNIVADICRERGAIDSPKAINIFTEFSQKGKNKTLRYVSVPMTRRATDEMVSFALYYLYTGGIFSDKFVGLESQSALNDMYRDEELIKRLSDPNDKLRANLDSLLKIIDAVVQKGRLSNLRNGGWGKGSIKKLIMLITEAANNAGGFERYKPDTDKLFNELKEAYTQLAKTKIPHHPFQEYQIIDNKVVPLSEDQQPKNVKKHETYQFPSVFTGGARTDDLRYIYHHFVTKGVLAFGLKTTLKDTTRTFNKKQTEELWVEQGGQCKKCRCDLNINEYAADHILGYAYGGPTETKNGQLLCVSCNTMKSSGMDINDVKYLCEKYGYDDFAGLAKYILKGTVSLTEPQIIEVKNNVILQLTS